MGFRRSALLTVMSVGFIAGAIVCRPAYAEEGELIAKEASAQINVRSLANTQADIIGAGVVGERVDILEHSVGNDALIWYRVKLLKSGHSGWIRGDFIKILGKPTAKDKDAPTKSAQTKPSGSSKVASSASGKTAAPVPLTPPKPPASAKSAAPTKPAASAKSPPTAKAAKPPSTSAPPDTSSSSKSEETKSQETKSQETKTQGTKTAASSTPSTASDGSTTIAAFQTTTYAVRLFSKSGQLRLNLFNRNTQEMALESVPVQSKSSSEGTTYSYQNEVKVTILVPTSGKPVISASSLGETLKEQQEDPEPTTSEIPTNAPSFTTAPTAPTPSTPLPAPATPPAPETPSSAPSPTATPAPTPPTP
jgi:Bacterial SH3 domain